MIILSSLSETAVELGLVPGPEAMSRARPLPELPDPPDHPIVSPWTLQSGPPTTETFRVPLAV